MTDRTCFEPPVGTTLEVTENRCADYKAVS